MSATPGSSSLATKVVARGWRLMAATANRRFATQLTCRSEAPVFVLSPHLDDAVLGCWSVLAADLDVKVFNVFSALPPAGSTTYWDSIAGFDDSQALFRARLAEDREALALAGRSPVNLPFREGQYRVARRPPFFAELDAAIAEHAAECSVVYAPANLGVMNSDHRLVRGYARALAAQRVEVRLYVDVPYAVEYGWPGWVTGERAHPHIDIDAFWRNDLAELGLTRDTATVVRLDEEQARAKLAAMRTYRTQFPTLDRGPIGRLSNPRLHSYEVFWPV